MTKNITIDQNKYELPEGMSTKDVQALDNLDLDDMVATAAQNLTFEVTVSQ